VAKKRQQQTMQDAEQLASVITRLKRANGQLSAIVRMLEEGRSCDEIVIQMSGCWQAYSATGQCKVARPWIHGGNVAWSGERLSRLSFPFFVALRVFAKSLYLPR